MTSRAQSEYSAVPDWEKLFQDRDFLHAWIDKALQEALASWEEGAVKDLYQSIAKAAALRSIDVVLAVSESPPERIFLAHIITAFLLRDPLSLVVPPPALYDRLGTAANTGLALKQLAEETGVASRDLKRDLLSNKEQLEHLGITLVYGTLGCLDSVHMIPQAQLVGIADNDPILEPLERKKFDIFFYKINRPDCQLVVECDGYIAHRKRFTPDRQRDRLLRRAGVDVLRFSAAEIFERPVACSLELQSYVEEKWQFDRFFT